MDLPSTYGIVLAEQGWHAGRDRHRRVAHRRGVRPPDGAHRARWRGREGLRPLDQRVRSARRAVAVPRPADALRRAPRGGGRHDRRAIASPNSRRRFNEVAASQLTRGRSRSRAARRPRASVRARRRRARERCSATWSRAASAIRRRCSWRAASPSLRRRASSARTGSSSCSQANGRELVALGWGMAPRASELDAGATIDVAYPPRARRVERRVAPAGAARRLSRLSVRIVAGRWRGRRIDAPRDERVRPTGDRVREAWMSIVNPWLAGARVLDLFAGSGALGLEALSRGADVVDFVEISRRRASLRCARTPSCSAPVPRRVIHRADALRFVERLEPHAYDVAFADPPYDLGLATALAERWLATPVRRRPRHRAPRRRDAARRRRPAEVRRHGDHVLSDDDSRESTRLLHPRTRSA